MLLLTHRIYGFELGAFSFLGHPVLCIPRDPKITLELFTWTFWGTELSGGGNGASRFAKGSCAFSSIHLTLQKFALPPGPRAVSGRQRLGLGGSHPGARHPLRLCADHSGLLASPGLLGGTPEWRCRLALDINALQLSSRHDGTQPARLKEFVPELKPPQVCVRQERSVFLPGTD